MSFDDDEAEVEYEVESFRIHSHEFHLTTISYMPIERLVDLQVQSKEISGQKLWCGSLCLMEYLTDFPLKIAGKNVLELGAGTGVVGMLCDKLGSMSGTRKSIHLDLNYALNLCYSFSHR
jgi:predicted nicotinamide N-methyase